MFQISIRELLVCVILLSLCVTGMFASTFVAKIALAFFFVAVVGLVILALVSRGKLRAISIGFLVPIIAYSIALYSTDANEFIPYRPKLPTSQLLGFIYYNSLEQTWVNEAGQVVDPNTPGVGGVGLQSENIDKEDFMLCGHLLALFVLSFAGSKLGGYIHAIEHPE